jgi:hypothetical protein
MPKEKKKDWVSYIQNVYAEVEASGLSSTLPIFHQPAPRQLIDKCENRLGAIFPNELRSLLLQTNGVSEKVLTVKGEIDSGYFLFSIEGILENNMFQRTQVGNYTMPLDCLLFFAEDGTGDYFGFAVVKGRVPHSRIYFWNHEDDSRLSIAPSLEYFIKNWRLGKIKV